MKKLTWVVLLFALSIHSNGQTTWCPNGAVWHYGIYWFSTIGYAEISYASDTVILGKPCKRLEEHLRYVITSGPGPEINHYNSLYTYDSNNVVYMFNLIQVSNTWDTLFNFNKIPGESWRYNNIDTFKVTVIDTGTNQINGVNLKWLYVNYHGAGIPNDTIYNRMGVVTSSYPFGPYNYLFTDPFIAGFCNYKDNLFLKYGYSDSVCTSIPTSLTEIADNQNTIMVSPNPFTNELSFHNLFTQQSFLIIYDVYGQKVLTQKLKDVTRVDTQFLSNGVYYYQICTDYGICAKGKLIKN
jgi:Secretion system C-terminal sorting domain